VRGMIWVDGGRKGRSLPKLLGAGGDLGRSSAQKSKRWRDALKLLRRVVTATNRSQGGEKRGIRWREKRDSQSRPRGFNVWQSVAPLEREVLKDRRWVVLGGY